ncbi:MAG TPA: outer membrane protein assembly factor BamA [Candidatus Hydrogenedens sp.]|nr:outer membrane protein assembly factor BamA [Candidatus Hydrogenedens sp.]HOK08306.1 outer membrane protein assembly factor BamA [Candidatus Hydrogenedens sp.]HOL18900.1 outer membrane protein assembly factor BamA [Candidatus Hydrogenedens sp.]HPP57600.1 outer membrane protein assembly factor BamA [Candidatus Hydrogenedens sp.]
MLRTRYVHVILSIVIFILCKNSVTQETDYSGKEVLSVNIQGLEKLNEQVVLGQVETKVGDKLNSRAVARDIKRIYNLGYFTKVSVEVIPEGDGVKVTYIVEEERRISDVKIIGCKKIKPRAIEPVLKQKRGTSFIPELCEEDRKAIINMYQAKGYANTKVDVITEKVEPGLVRIIYSIDEGKKARIKEIEIEGNSALSDRQVKKAMKTKPAWWFLGGKYDETKFETDLENIVNKYGDHGYLDAKVTHTDVLYTDNGKKLRIKLFVEEGDQYKVQSLQYANNIVFDAEELEKDIKVKPEDIHNKGQVAKDAQVLEKKYQDSGYVDATVTPQVSKDEQNKTTNIVYNISESELKYIKQVDITGNDVTQDEVIRRQVLVKPGERYDGSAVESSRLRLENTDYFDKIRITLHDDEEDPRYSNLLVDVEEGKTNTFLFGAGYSTDEGVGGFAQLRLRNFDITNWPSFSGGGQQFSARVHVGDRRDRYSVSFTDPEIFGYPISLGVDLYDESYWVRSGADYRENQTGGQIRFGKALSLYNTARLAFRVEDVDISDLSWFINPEIRKQTENSTTVSTILSLERNTLDRYRDPSRGINAVLSSELAGLGGDNNFVKLQLDFAWYRALDKDKKWVFMLRTREGWMTEYGDSDYIPLIYRFYAGGTTTVRGYDYRDIGPKIREYGFFGDWIAKGGNLRLVNNLELKYKVTNIFRIYSFIDMGGVWEDEGDIDLSDLRYSSGLGIGAEIPKIGPIRVDYGIPLNPDDDQGHGRLHLTTGLQF